MSVRHQKGGIFDAIEIHKKMTPELVKKLHDIYNDYDDDLKIGIRHNIPSGQPIEFYVCGIHIIVMLASWHTMSEQMMFTVSFFNARIGYIVHNMAPTHIMRFCRLVNELGKFDTGVSPGGDTKDNETTKDV